MKYVSMDGLLLVNKPKTWTSFDVCNFIRHRFRIKKVGHTGTLDPQATGVMLILLGRYTRLSQMFTDQRKSYRGILRFGTRTDSQDGDGRVVEEKPWAHITPDAVLKMTASFRGSLMQKPPMISAVKHKGKRLYKLARKGEIVERDSRPITVYRFDVEQIDLPRVHFLVEVSKGTYVRTLAEDFGTALGSTAFLEELCRVTVGKYSLDECVDVSRLEALKDPGDLEPFITSDVREDLHETSISKSPASI